MADNSSSPAPDDWVIVAHDYGFAILDEEFISIEEEHSETDNAEEEEEEEHDVTSILAGSTHPVILGGVDLNDQEEDEVDYEADDVDDELVPWESKGRLVRNRMRKVGKRGGPKVTKEVSYYHNRPGCLRGKHGFGVQQTSFFI